MPITFCPAPAPRVETYVTKEYSSQDIIGAIDKDLENAINSGLTAGWGDAEAAKAVELKKLM